MFFKGFKLIVKIYYVKILIDKEKKAGCFEFS